MEGLLECAGRWAVRRAGLRAVQWTGQRAGSYAGLWAVRRAYWRGIRPAAHRTVAYQTQPGDTTFGTECASHGAGLRAPLLAPRQAGLRTGRRVGRLQYAWRAGPCAGLWAGPCAGRRAVLLAGIRGSSILSALSPP